MHKSISKITQSVARFLCELPVHLHRYLGNLFKPIYWTSPHIFYSAITYCISHQPLEYCYNL